MPSVSFLLFLEPESTAAWKKEERLNMAACIGSLLGATSWTFRQRQAEITCLRTTLRCRQGTVAVFDGQCKIQGASECRDLLVVTTVNQSARLAGVRLDAKTSVPNYWRKSRPSWPRALVWVNHASRNLGSLSCRGGEKRNRDREHRVGLVDEILEDVARPLFRIECC